MAKKHTILIADDEKNAREGLQWALEGEKYEVFTASDGAEAREIIAARPIHLLITDLKMPGMDGMELLKSTGESSPDTEVIILTGHGTVEGAVEAMKMGAFDYLIKPVKLDELGMLVERVLQRRDLREENEALKQALSARHGFENIIARSGKMLDVFKRVRQVAPTRATVMLTGASGTGKELIANAIHYNSPRKNNRFIAVNCGALTPTLLESELFGHEAGAFTDARKQKIGRFEMAEGGTIFLDEITETSPEFQVRLLRVLQEREFERVGGSETIQVDVRVVTATNQDIDALVADGKFRQDLFYRLNVIRIDLPPLRERPEDIPLMVQAFVEEFAEENGKKELIVAPRALQALCRYPWPGNVRQLKNAVEGMVVLSSGKELGVKNLPEEVRASLTPRRTVQLDVGGTLADVEREVIRATLQQTEGNVAAAARTLGVTRKTLYRKMEQYQIDN